LHRWYRAVFPLLKNYYGTGGDLNVDELKDVIPITEKLGLWHPQEGIVNGHFQSTAGEKVNIIGQLRYGCAKIVENPHYVPEGPYKYAVADLITGYGVSESIKHYYDLFRNETLKDKKVIVQGWGNVASAAAAYLSFLGAKIIGIIDKDGGLLKPEGLDFEDIKRLFVTKRGNKLWDEDMISFEETNEKIWNMGAEIFIPGAASKLVTRAQVDALMEGGIEVISCGANVPFVDDQIFFGPTAKYTDEQVSLIPDFIANCGMARVFAYLMQKGVKVTDRAIFTDVSDTIKAALEEVRAESSHLTGIASRSLAISLQKIMPIEETLAN